MAPPSTKTTEKKPAKAAKFKAKPAAAPKPDEQPAETAAQGALKLKDLIDSVAVKTGGRKPEVKAAVEATLAALGEALACGKSLTVPPLGKLRVAKAKGPALTLKLRQAGAAKAAGKPLADDGEDD